MNEKVKLPKFICDWLDQHKEELCGYPMTDVSTSSKERDIIIIRADCIYIPN